MKGPIQLGCCALRILHDHSTVCFMAVANGDVPHSVAELLLQTVVQHPMKEPGADESAWGQQAGGEAGQYRVDSRAGKGWYFGTALVIPFT